MANIHLSAYMRRPLELSPDLFHTQLEECAAELQNTAKQYLKLAKFLKSKKIKLSDIEGDAHCGSFTVDEIDTGRLVTAKIVVDKDKNPEADDDCAFFVDSKLDAMLAESGCHDDHSNEAEVLADALSEQESDEDGIPDGMVYDDEAQEFIFKCSDCEEVHTQPLEEVYDGIEMAKMLLRGLSETRDDEEDVVADEADHAIYNLGFLQKLLEMEFGMGPHCTCDHHHDDEEDDENEEVEEEEKK